MTTPLGSDAQRAREIDALFDEALDLAPADWPSFLAEKCPETLREEVRLLLEEVGEDESETMLGAGAIWRGAVGDLVMSGDDAGGPLQAGDRIGAYRIIREGGRGGMAAVYLAERADGVYEQQVALKVALSKHRDGRSRARFQLERQILAELRHPNIAALLDGGLSDEGHPYFVMEWVDGETIDVHCDRLNLSINERLRLFVDVVRAVETAHRSLIVHRDIKPSNVLVGKDGQVKLLDFGIAKVLGTDGAPDITRTVASAMTPDYAAPEQLADEPLTTAVDVYQLGLLLYEILSGCRPFAGRSLVERIKSDHATRRPTTALVEADSELISRHRSTNPRGLQRALRGDVETILAKALQRQPERRYASAKLLADDIEAHLEGRPIEARGDSVLYRARKLVQRHALSTAITVVAIILLVGVMIASNVRLRQQRDLAETRRQEAEENRLEAQRSRDEAEEVVDFLVDLFEVSRSGTARADSISALDLLERGAEKIAQDLTDRPLVRARLTQTLGRVYRELTEWDHSEELVRESLRLRELELGEDHLLVASTLDDLGWLQQRTGRLQEAQASHERALAIREAAYGPEHPEVAASLNSLSAVAWTLGDYERTETLLRRSFEIRNAILGPEHEDTAASMKNLGLLLRAQGHYEEAESFARRAVVAYTAAKGSRDPLVAGAYNGLGNVFLVQDRFEEAEPHLKKALEIWLETMGPDHLNVGMAMENLAAVYRGLERYEEALPLNERSLEIQLATHGTEHTSVGRSSHNLAGVLMGLGRLDEAESRIRETLRIYRKAWGDTHPEIARTTSRLGEIQALAGRLDEAEKTFREAAAMREDLLGPDHPQLADSLQPLAELLIRTGRSEEAEELLRRALRIRVEAGRADAAETRTTLVDLLEASGRSEEAEQLQEPSP